MAPNPQMAVRPQNWIVLRIRENGYTPPNAEEWQIRICLEGTTDFLPESEKRIMEANGTVLASFGPAESKRYFIQVWRDDSSGKAVSGEAKYLSILPGSQPSRTLGIHVTPVALATPTLQIVNRTGLASATTSLGIGQFDGAYDSDASPIRNEASDSKNFVGSDSRRFWFRVTDSTPMDYKLSLNGLKTIELLVSTVNPDGSIRDNNGGKTQITATQTAAGAATFETRPIMMVTNIDRDEEVHCGLPSGTYSNLKRKRGETNYRLRLAGVDTIIESTYISTIESRQGAMITGESFISSERRVLRVHVFVLRQDDSSDPVRKPEEIEEQFNWLELTYAAIGIQVRFEQHPDAVARGAEMRNSNGRQYHLINASVLAVAGKPTPNVNAITEDDRTAFANVFQLRNHAVRCLFTGGLISPFGSGTFGLAYPNVDFAPNIEGCCFFGVLQAFINGGASPKDIAKRFPHTPTMPHEVGHILTNKSTNNGLHYWAGTHNCNCIHPDHNTSNAHTCRCQNQGHYTAPNGAGNTPPTDHHSHNYNIMGGSRAPRLWDCDINETAPAGSFNQYTNIRSNATYITTS